MNTPIKSPCAECKRGDKDKNNDICTNCAARQAYVAAMGAPWDMGPLNTKPKREVKPMVEQAVLKLCRKCKIKKPLTDFTKDKTRPGGLALVCRQCKNEYQQKQRAPVGRSDTKAGKKITKDQPPKWEDINKIKAIYVDPPLPTPVDDICDAIARHAETTVGQEYSDDFLSIDMAGHGDVLDRLTELAIKELRSVEMQALFILREALCHHQNNATS